MKYCPKCQRAYADETQSFCLQDGSTLLHSDPQAETLEVRGQGQTMPQPSSNEIEMIHQIVTLSIGEYFEFTPKYRTIRVTFKDIVKQNFAGDFTAFITSKELAAQLHVDTGGGLVFCGDQTIKHDTNEYLVPPKTGQLEEARSVYYFYTSESHLTFFRTFVKHINPHGKQADLNLFHLSYRRD